MSQDFHGNVGQVAGGDIQNFDVQVHLPSRIEEKGLVPAQRAELHELRALCEELGDDPRDVWRRVHAQLGVKSLSNIRADQFPMARDVIQARLEQLREEADKRRLIGKVLRAATEKDAKAELNNFCDVTFGRTHLSNLKRTELQRVLEFIQGFEVLTPRPVATPEPVTQQVVSKPERLALREFLITYKANAFWLFMFGIIVDRFWFR